MGIRFWVVTLDGSPIPGSLPCQGCFPVCIFGLSPKQGLRFVAPLTCLGATLEVGEVFLRMWSIPGGRCIRAFPLTSGSTNAAVKKGSTDYSTCVPCILLSNKKKQATDACNDSTHAPGILLSEKKPAIPKGYILDNSFLEHVWNDNFRTGGQADGWGS